MRLIVTVSRCERLEAEWTGSTWSPNLVESGARTAKDVWTRSLRTEHARAPDGGFEAWYALLRYRGTGRVAVLH